MGTGAQGGRQRSGTLAPSDVRFSSDSSEDEGNVAAGAKRAIRGGGDGDGRVGVEEGEGDESLDDEEEQRGVVKKLRLRTEVGRMG